jgi:hypothetical protein
MAHAWKACWVKALGGSNPPSSANRAPKHLERTFMKLPKLGTRILRLILSESLQIKFGLKTLRASVDPLEPVLMTLERSGKLSIIEIGTRWGESLRYLSLKFPIKKYVAIDPYEAYEEYVGDGFNKILETKSGDEIFKSTLALGTKLLGERFTLVREYSDVAHNNVEDEGADFIFVDGNHRYPYVLEDLRNFWPKLRPGGYLCGHDFFMRSRELGGDYDEPMVFEAVMEFCNHNDLAVQSYGVHGDFPMCFAIQKKA